MNKHQLLGQLSQLQQMTADLFSASDEKMAYQSFDPHLPPLAWLFGRCIYIETYWLREVVANDSSLTDPIKSFFAHDAIVDSASIKKLPPKDHLLNWALERQDQNLTQLANDSALDHPLLHDDLLLWRILDEYALRYEQMVMQCHEISLHNNTPYQPTQALTALPPTAAHAEMHSGHYRVGAKPQPSARANELPTQIVELTAFRIDTQLINNGQWLSFMKAGGYQETSYWSDQGREWLQQNPHQAPHTWRQDILKNWYQIGLNGACDLIADEPVSGVNHHEASAYSQWVSTLDDALKGAVLQHEYQWESSKRTGAIHPTEQVWEWCSNDFMPYTGYEQASNAELASYDIKALDEPLKVLRGASMHTALFLRSARYRKTAAPAQRSLLAGVRLVFPPSIMPWH